MNSGIAQQGFNTFLELQQMLSSVFEYRISQPQQLFIIVF